MTSTQPRIQSGRFTTFGHSAPTFGLPAHRYPSELPYQPTEKPFSSPEWELHEPVKLFTRRHETPIRNAMEAAGVTDLEDLKVNARTIADSINAIQARIQQRR